jgi:60 kDa SS-A/Ro ribonucleoprotein
MEMARTNKKPMDYRLDKDARLAGGHGARAAKQDAEALLRRAVLAHLLWEDLFYEDGQSVVDNIHQLVPHIEPIVVAQIAIEARTVQKLRHVPLFLINEMVRYGAKPSSIISWVLPKIILRPDELAELVAIYWKDGKQPLTKQMKKGLAEAFHNFDAYQLAKWNRDYEIKLRDVLFLVHAKPRTQEEVRLFQQLADDELPTPDTWEVSLSGGKDKKATWTRLIGEHKLGALAFLRNLRNMEDAGVSRNTIQYGFDTINPRWLVPLNYLAAARVVPKWEREIETLMLKGLANAPKLPGYSIFVVDVSGSMGARISYKSALTRLDAAYAMSILAAEMCEHVSIYATAGNDWKYTHATKLVAPRRGFGLIDELSKAKHILGGGGIFTRQCLEYIRARETTTPDRIIIFSDSQDCDHPAQSVPNPFGTHNYIIDVSSHSHGINYKGLWDAEISGWSEHFLKFIAALEGIYIPQGEESNN